MSDTWIKYGIGVKDLLDLITKRVIEHDERLQSLEKDIEELREKL